MQAPSLRTRDPTDGVGQDKNATAVRVGRRVRVLRRDLDQLLAEAEASATSASQPGADAGQDGEGWPDAQAFWGGP